jgi:hypothetical protein
MLDQVTRDIPAGEHPMPERHAYMHDNRRLLTIIAVLFTALVIICLVVFKPPTNNGVARLRAEQLQQVLRRRGLPVAPSLKVLSSSLGTDGGVVCKASGYNLTDAILNQQDAAGSGALSNARVLPVESEILNGQLAIIDVYCPSRAPAFINHFGKYKLYDLTPR